MLETIITELAPAVLSVVAVLISMLKGKAKKVKTAEEIENIAEAKKQKLVAKLKKKNKIKPIENNENNESIFKGCESMLPLPEIKMESKIEAPSWQQAFGVKTEKESETQGE